MNRFLGAFLHLSSAVLLTASVPVWAVPAGTIEFVLGDVRVRAANGVERRAAKGTVVEVGETVLAAANGNAQIRMIDNAFLAVRPSTELQVSEYSYSGKADGTENAVLRLVNGTMRAFTGAITQLRKDRFVMRTATSTIGIRGSGNVAHYSPVNGTINHTIEGSHVTTSINQQGQAIGSAITNPGQTVQVQLNQPPVRIPTPTFILQAVTAAAKPAPAPSGAPATAAAETAEGAPAPADSSAPPAADSAPAATEAAVTRPTAVTTDTALATVDTTPVVAPVVVATPSASQTELSGTTSSGTLDLTQGTLTTTGGSEVTLTPGTPIASLITAPPPTNANGYLDAVLTTKASGSGFVTISAEPRGTKLAENFLLDSAGNLIENRQTSPVHAQGFNFTDTTTDTTSTGASRFFRFSGGTAQDTFKSTDGNLFLGRWQGGSLGIYSDTGALGGTTLIETINLGLRSAHWFLAAAASANYTQKLTGARTYSLIASTRPTDALGNVGTLNSASLSADFSSQTAVAGLNLSFASTGTNIVMTTPSVPLDPNGGFNSTTTSPYPPAINGCAGSSCSGYHGGVRGGVTLSDASGVAMGYRFFPNPGTVSANTPFSDAIEGLAAFTTATAPAIGSTPTPVSSGQYVTQSFYTVGGLNGAQFLAANRTTPATGRLPATAFIFQGNDLVRAFGGAWNVFDRGEQSQCLFGTPCLVPTTIPNDSVSVFSISSTVGTSGFSFSNGLSATGGATESYNDGTGIRFGRYQGGTVNASSNSGGFVTSAVTPLGSNSLLWSTREIPSSIPLTGVWHYTPAFGTAPADGVGNLGTLNWARLVANFFNQTVNPAVQVSIDNKVLTGWAQDVPINSSSFSYDVSSSGTLNATLTPPAPFALNVTCTGTNCAPAPVGVPGEGYGGRLSGGFAGSGTADTAFMRYTFNTRYDPAAAPGSGATGAAPAGRVANDYINGLVGFTKGPEITQPSFTALGKNLAGTYFYYPSSPLFYGSNDVFTSFNADGLDDVITFAGPNGNFNSTTSIDGTGQSIAVGGDTSGASTVTTLSNGISFGRYAARNVLESGPALTVSGKDHQGAFTGRNILGSFHWIQGPDLWPIFGNQLLSGTASYSLLGSSAPTDQNNATGTLSSANFAVNFDRQSVSFDMALNMPGNRNWLAIASDVALEDSGGFFTSAGSGGSLAHRGMQVQLNALPASGNVSGRLTGPGASGAMLSYIFSGSDQLNMFHHEHVNGVVAFGSPSFSIQPSFLAPYQIRLGSLGTVDGFDANTGAVSAASASKVDGDYLAHTVATVHDPARLKTDSQGAVVEADSYVPIVSGASAGFCSPGVCSVNEIPVRVSINPSGSAASGTLPAMPAISGTAATVSEFGMDPVTGISWGRYSNGNFAVVDRVTGQPISSGTPGGPINHYLLTAVQSGPTTLPATGSATYTFVGSTRPTDSAGNVGTLNSASLSANFSAKTVSTSVDLTAGTRNWTASASNVPIVGGVGFHANRNLSGTGNLTVNCAGCSGSLAGQVMGVFTGSTGQGAGIAYSLHSGSTATAAPVTVGGVAAFRR